MTFIPLSMRAGYIWLNGEFVESDSAQIHILTNSLHYASAVFEGERAYDSKVFKLEEHTQRLFSSAEILKHKKPIFSLEEVNKATIELIKMNNLKDCYIRPLIWRGSESMRLTSPMLSTNIMIACWEMGGGGEGKRADEFNVVLSKWRKAHPSAMPPQCKSAGAYQTNVVAQLEAIEQGFDDALMLDYDGRIAECTTSNIFFVDNDKLVTPKPDVFLHGITMQTVLEMARELGITTEERRIQLDEIGNFNECFITGTAAGIKKVNSITVGNHKITYKSDEVTKRLINLYEEVVRR